MKSVEIQPEPVEHYPGGVDLNWVKNNPVAVVAGWLGRDVVRGVDYPTDQQIAQEKLLKPQHHKVLENSRHDK